MHADSFSFFLLGLIVPSQGLSCAWDPHLRCDVVGCSDRVVLLRGAGVCAERPDCIG